MVRKKYHHSIVFGDGTLENGQFTGLDTYEDFHLIPSSRPTIAPPGVETKFVTIPGRDGSIDLSEFLRAGRPAYGDRSGTFEFYVENDWDDDARLEEYWMSIYPKLINQIHGKRFKMVLREDDPDFYWEGRFTVDKYEAGDGHHSVVSISYAVSPFKRRIRKNSELTVWDNFNFEKEYDHDPLSLNSLTVTQETELSIWGDGYPFQIEAVCTSGMATVSFGGEAVIISHSSDDESSTLIEESDQGQGSSAIADRSTALIGHAQYGANPLIITPISGPATVSIDWRGGGL